MSKKNSSLLNEFNVHKKEIVIDDVKDYEVFPDKAKLELIKFKLFLYM